METLEVEADVVRVLARQGAASASPARSSSTRCPSALRRRGAAHRADRGPQQGDGAGEGPVPRARPARGARHGGQGGVPRAQPAASESKPRPGRAPGGHRQARRRKNVVFVVTAAAARAGAGRAGRAARRHGAGDGLGARRPGDRSSRSTGSPTARAVKVSRRSVSPRARSQIRTSPSRYRRGRTGRAGAAPISRFDIAARRLPRR